MAAGATIPLARTNSPYSFQDAFNGLTQTNDQIDVTQLATAFNTISDAFANTPQLNKAALTGLTSLNLRLPLTENETTCETATNPLDRSVRQS